MTKAGSTEAVLTESPRTGNTVMVCSKLATAIKLNYPDDPSQKVVIRGLNSAPRGTNNQPIIVPYMVTEVPADFWAAWDGRHGLKSKKPFPAIKSGAIFTVQSAAEANDRTKEEEKRLTGFEGMLPDKDARMGQSQVAKAIE